MTKDGTHEFISGFCFDSAPHVALRPLTLSEAGEVDVELKYSNILKVFL